MNLTTGAVVVTAIAAYGCVKKITDALKWRAYYKCPNEGAIPPGYSMHKTTQKSGENNNEEKEIKTIDDLAEKAKEKVKETVDEWFGAEETTDSEDTDK